MPSFSFCRVIWIYAPAVNPHRLLLWVLCWLLDDWLSAQTHLPHSALGHWGWDPVNHTSFLSCGWLEETKSETGEGIYSFLLCFLLLCCQHHCRVSASLSIWQLVSVPEVSSSLLFHPHSQKQPDYTPPRSQLQQATSLLPRLGVSSTGLLSKLLNSCNPNLFLCSSDPRMVAASHIHFLCETSVSPFCLRSFLRLG